MQGILFSLFASFVTLTGFAQATGHAEVAVTIVNPAGVTEMPEVNKTLPVSFFATAKQQKGKIATNQTLIELASFKIAGAENHFTLSLPSSTIRMVNQLNKNSFFLENLQVFSVASQQVNSFTLSSKPVAQTNVSAGNYFNSTQLDITIHFN